MHPEPVPGSWLIEREIGRARLTGKRFANIYSSQWIAYLRTGDVDFDLSLLISQRRSLTQQMARHIYDLQYDGIYYQSGMVLISKIGLCLSHLTWKTKSKWILRDDDPDFREALARFGLTFDSLR